MLKRLIYRRRDSWVLCTCCTCGEFNYVEPHGTTARCRKCGVDTEHQSIPQECRDASGTFYVREMQRH